MTDVLVPVLLDDTGQGNSGSTMAYAPAQLDANRALGINPSSVSVSSRLLAQVETARFEPVTDLTTDAPTITSGTVATITGRQIGVQTGNVRLVGSKRAFDNVNSRQPVVFSSGVDFYVTDTDVELALFPNISAALPILIYVDGKPMTLDSDSTSVPAVTPVATFVKLHWATLKRRHIEFFWDAQAGGIFYVACNIGGVITPGPAKPLVATVGDSFFSSSTVCNNLQAADFLACRKLGVDSVSPSYGGTGWVAPGAFVKFGDASRITDVQNIGTTPDLIVFQGSVNDDGLSGIQAAVSSALAAWTAAFPTTPIIVFGPQPTDATTTVSATRQANIAAVKAAAIGATNVIGFHDEIGTAASVPAAWASQVYNDGDLVNYRGAIWKMYNNGVARNPGPPQSNRFWKLVTWDVFGTGKVGTVVGDGPRDTMLHSDGIHPVAEMQRIWAEHLASEIVADLRNWAGGGTIRIT